VPRFKHEAVPVAIDLYIGLIWLWRQSMTFSDGLAQALLADPHCAIAVSFMTETPHFSGARTTPPSERLPSIVFSATIPRPTRDA
jgi:hypothetical protein